MRWLDAPLARQRKPGLQAAEHTWLTSGAVGLKLANPPFVFGFNMLGDALRDVLDPRLRGSARSSS